MLPRWLPICSLAEHLDVRRLQTYICFTFKFVMKRSNFHLLFYLRKSKNYYGGPMAILENTLKHIGEYYPSRQCIPAHPLPCLWLSLISRLRRLHWPGGARQAASNKHYKLCDHKIFEFKTVY